jgi:Outer membrane protein beta-barrel domain
LKTRNIVFSVLVFTILTTPAVGQQVPRWEIGPTLSLITLQEYSRNHHSGFGGRLVVNFSDILAADLQSIRISKTYNYPQFASRIQYTHDQFTANLKATWRHQNAIRLNPFVLAGMGWVRDGYKDTFGVPFPNINEIHQDKFALRFGGGVEIVLHRRFSIRLDASDLSSRVPTTCPAAGPPYICANGYWWNRLDTSLSTMVRLGGLH